MPEAFPLQWPEGWNRARSRSRSPFKISDAAAMEKLLGELRRFAAAGIVISTNIALRRDGLPAVNQPLLSDPGVAVYYSTQKWKQQVLACDKWDRVHHNIYAIARTIECWRRIERDGASQILERSFSAFGALPAAASAAAVKPWWEELHLKEAAIKGGHLTLAMVEAQYRELAKQRHPDRNGGDDKPFKALGVAMDQARKHFGK